MQFSTLALVALCAGSSLAQTSTVVVHVVTVGNANGSLTYSPNNLKAATGDMVQFQFMPNNHTVTQSAFDSPCVPLGGSSMLYTGYMPVAQNAVSVPTYTIMVKDQTPMWLFCSQANHCQSGMTMVINENTSANASRSLAAYQALAKTATTISIGAAGTGTTGTATTPAGGVASSVSASAVPNVTAASAANALDVSDVMKLSGALAFTLLFLL